MDSWIDTGDGSGKQAPLTPADFVAYLRERDAELRLQEQQIEVLEERIHALEGELATLQHHLIAVQAERDALRSDVESGARVRVERDVLRHELDRLAQLAATDERSRPAKRASRGMPNNTGMVRTRLQTKLQPRVPRQQQGLFARLFTKQEYVPTDRAHLDEDVSFR